MGQIRYLLWFCFAGRGPVAMEAAGLLLLGAFHAKKYCFGLSLE